MAAILPVQGMAAFVACTPASVPGHHAQAAPAAATAHCAHHGQKSPATAHVDQGAGHDAPCSACCAALAPQGAMAVPVATDATRFAGTDPRYADFIPSGLKRPPSPV